MKRWLIALFLLAAPVAAEAAAPFDVIVALQNLRAGRDADALYWLNRAIDSRELKDGDLADALEWRAFLHAGRKNMRAARADLDAAIAAQSANPLRLRARARFFLRAGDYRAALADMEAVMARLPTDAENHTDYCEALFRSRRRDEAADYCRRAVRLNPEYARPRTLLKLMGY
jgi:tetratricopeptide (TPR) repeat protein